VIRCSLSLSMRKTVALPLFAGVFAVLTATAGSVEPVEQPLIGRQEAAAALTRYFEEMSVPKPFPVLTGERLEARQKELRGRLLADVGLAPLPERIDLDVHKSAPIDHPWCTIEKIEYQLWPGVYTAALLFVPKEFPEKPAPAMLCPHGHWDHGYAFPDVQKRCIVLAKMGYVALSPRQNHLEDQTLGLSHQTLMIWANMRGIDYLQSLPEVDPGRIGVAGASGGGLQTQMITALDTRVKAATIVGLTCDYREVLFPYDAHCFCNHWPNVMSYTDWPEISALAFPRPVQYLTMNDWTRHFPHDNYPAILELYRANGYADRVSCTYWPTEHVYDRPKRERTYWWMEKWLRQKGSVSQPIPAEPDEVSTVFPPEVLEQWPVENPNNKGLDRLIDIFRENFHFSRADIATPTDWTAHKERMTSALPWLLGLNAGLPHEPHTLAVAEQRRHRQVIVERVFCPAEGHILIPALVVRPALEMPKPSAITIVLSRHGSAPSSKALEAYMDRAKHGETVVLPDVRFTGVYDLVELAGVMGPGLVQFDIAYTLALKEQPEEQRKHLLWAWERNSIVWGHSVVGMTVSDIQCVLGSLANDAQADVEHIRIETHDAAYLGLAAVFAAVLDPRIRELDVDFVGCRYESYRTWNEDPNALPVVPFILRYGDVPDWIAVIADRDVAVRNLKADTDEVLWLSRAFAAMGNETGFKLGT